MHFGWGRGYTIKESLQKHSENDTSTADLTTKADTKLMTGRSIYNVNIPGKPHSSLKRGRAG